MRPYVPTAPPPTLSVCFLYLNFLFTSLPCPFAFLCTSLLSITSSPSTLLLPSPAPSNLAEVFETMPGYSKHRYTLKRVANETFPTCIGRGASFEKAFLGFQEQIKQLEPRDAESQVSPAGSAARTGAPRPPLRATAGAPGCGKTYFLDELAAMRPEMVKTHCPKSLRPWFDRANVLAVNITFNGDTPFDAATETLETEKRGAALLIASRILYR